MKLPFQKPAVPAARRRTVAGNRAPVYSYHASRSTGQRTTPARQPFHSVLTAEDTSRAVRYSLRRIGVIAVLAVGVMSLISILTLTPDPKVVLPGNTPPGLLHPSATYETAARKLLAASLANRTKLTIDTAALSVGLRHQFPELASVSVKLPLVGHRPVIYLQPAQPVVALLTTNGQAIGIDARGDALGPADPAVGLPVVKDESGAIVQPGQQALPATTVAFIQSALFQLQQKHLGVATLVLPARSSELDIYLDGKAYYVKCNLALSGTAREQIGTFLAVQHQLAEQGSLPRQYIDVRVAGRAYYR